MLAKSMSRKKTWILLTVTLMVLISNYLVASAFANAPGNASASTPGDPITDAVIAAVITIIYILIALQMLKSENPPLKGFLEGGLGQLLTMLIKKIPEPPPPPLPPPPKQPTPCTLCQGKKMITCGICGGSGWDGKILDAKGAIVKEVGFTEKCPACGNSATPGLVTCGRCEGSGNEPELPKP